MRLQDIASGHNINDGFRIIAYVPNLNVISATNSHLTIFSATVVIQTVKPSVEQSEWGWYRTLKALRDSFHPSRKKGLNVTGGIRGRWA